MSGLVERVRDSVRSKSGRRKSTSRHGPRSSTDLSDTDSRRGRASEEVNDGRAPILPPTIPAWHVHKGSAASNGSSGSPRTSNDVQSNVGGVLSSGRQNEGHRHTGSTASEKLSARTSSLRPGSQAESTQPMPQDLSSKPLPEFPRRKQSLPQRKSLPSAANDGQEKQLHQHLSELSVESPRNGHNGVNGAQAGRRAVENDMIPPPLELRRHEASQPQLSDHLRLPAGFSLDSRETTSVDTQWKPAVTHEHIYPHRTEIIQEAISRDIHVHHYYTYVQPIKVVEVLPPRHFRIDEHTGQKIEIAAPAGWMMPHDMVPRPVDTSMVKAESRHYLVDEQHPNGIAEPPPVGFEDEVKQMLRLNGHGRHSVQTAV